MRRRLVLASLIAAFALALWPHGHPAVAAVRASGKTVANQVEHSMPAFTVGALHRDTGERVEALSALAGAEAVGTTGGAEMTLSVTSPVIDAGQLFERVGLHYRLALGAEGSVITEIRTSSNGIDWDEWRIVHASEDLVDKTTNTHYVNPQPAPQTSRFAQYRAWLTRGDPRDLEHIALTFLDVNDLNEPLIARIANDVKGALTDLARSYFGDGYAMAAPSGASRTLDRQAWAADETKMKWTPKYVPWQKAVVHHTVTSDGGTNVAAEIRSIYHFHAVTRGWGDIGYQFLIDKFGNIWQGRAGGDNVVGGHAFGWNDGTFAVSAIGDYSIVAPTGALQGAIANVIAMKMKQIGIAPYANGTYTHEEQRSDGSWVKVSSVVTNVIGHSDCSYKIGIVGAQTACPGGRIYNMLNGLRSLAQTAYDNGYTYLTRLEPQLPTGGYPGQQIQVPVVITNRGATAIPAGTSVAYRILQQGNVVTSGPGAALTQPIAPGATGSVNATFIAPPVGSYMVRWGLASGATWWNTLYNDPVREQWFRSADWSAAWLRDDITRNWTAGEARMVTATVRNDGGRVWPATGTNPVKVGHYWISTATGNRFEAQTLAPLPFDVRPGQTVTMTFPVTAPVYPTNYSMVLDLRKENEFWFADKGLRPDDTEVTVATDFKASYTLPQPLPKFESGKTLTFPVTVTNIGKGTFPITGSYPINLSYHWIDAKGAATVWDGLRTKLPADLLAGQSVTVAAQVAAPPSGGSFTLRLDMVQEGIGWSSTSGGAPLNAPVSVAGPFIAAYGATYQPGVSTLARSGGVAAIPFTITNGSNFTWSPTGTNPVTLSYHWVNAQGRTVVWEGARTALPKDIAPGETANVQAQVVFPVTQGTYTLRWDLVHEGLTWFSGKGVRTFDQTVVVGPPAFYGGSMDVAAVPSTLPLQMPVTVPLRVQNLSNFEWDTLVNLSYHWYDASGRAVIWDGVRTPLAGIRPQEVRSVSANVLAPVLPGTYTLRFDIVHEGVTWFSGRGMQLAPISVKVERAPYAALYSAPPTVTGAANATITVPVSVTNMGTLLWQTGTVSLAYHLYAASGNVFVWEGARTTLPQPLGVGQAATLNAVVRMPATPGTFTIRFDLVHEGVAWFSGQNVPTTATTLTVQ